MLPVVTRRVLRRDVRSQAAGRLRRERDAFGAEGPGRRPAPTDHGHSSGPGSGRGGHSSPAVG